MDYAEGLQITNVILSLLSIYPTIFLFKIIFSDRKRVKNYLHPLNLVLLLFFGTLFIGILINAILYLLFIFEVPHDITLPISRVRSVFFNFLYFVTTWSLYIVYKNK